MHQDGVIQLEIKLTGILSTYCLRQGETAEFGTEVFEDPDSVLPKLALTLRLVHRYPGVNAHNHQHLFSLRLDPSIDGDNNTVFEVDAVPSSAPLGSAENRYGNAFYAKKTKLETMGTGKFGRLLCVSSKY
jgi:primary-amine oxidase